MESFFTIAFAVILYYQLFIAPLFLQTEFSDLMVVTPRKSSENYNFYRSGVFKHAIIGLNKDTIVSVHNT